MVSPGPNDRVRQTTLGGDAVFRTTFHRVAQLQHLKKGHGVLFFIILYIPFVGVHALDDTVT